MAPANSCRTRHISANVTRADRSRGPEPGCPADATLNQAAPAAGPWHNAEPVVAPSDDELAAAIARFKRQPGGNLGVPGSVRTAQRFARPGLIDEYVLHVHPVAIGTGKPLFTQKTNLKLVSTRTYDCGIVQLRCQPARPAAEPLPASA